MMNKLPPKIFIETAFYFFVVIVGLLFLTNKLNFTNDAFINGIIFILIIIIAHIVVIIYPSEKPVNLVMF
ncbi:MAG: hypothetical protein CVU81_01090 [Euryarchaeota archaeon HGW-Euryarchaeota-1]|nr:MAG: hypothetical protein CVU81_01090 [Euryarchaeota archaeon HGW-Euryarchaeota-1]